MYKTVLVGILIRAVSNNNNKSGKQ